MPKKVKVSRPALPAWHQRAAKNMTSNVVQSVFNRELGFPLFTKSAELMSNYNIEKTIGRQLLKSRPVTNKETSYPMDIDVVKFETGKTKEARPSQSDSRSPQGWFQVDLRKSKKVHYMDGFFWVHERISYVPPRPFRYGEGPTPMCTNVFYKLEQDPSYGFKAFKSCDTRDKTSDHEFVGFRALSDFKTMYSSMIVVLDEEGGLTVFDISDVNKIKFAKTVSVKPTDPPKLRNTLPFYMVRFTEFTVDYIRKSLICSGVSVGNTACLVFLSFPPALEKTMILYIEPQLFLQMWGTVAAQIDANKVQLFDSNTLIAGCKELAPTSSGCIQKVMTEMPSAPLWVVPTAQKYLGLLDFNWPPLCFKKSRDELMLTELAGDRHMRPLWSCGYDSFTSPLFSPLPDVSNSAFVWNGANEYVVTWIKKRDYPPSYKVKIHMPFSSGNDNSHQEEPRPSASTRARIPRACKNKKRYVDDKISVLGIDYCEILDLLLVCASKDDYLTFTSYETITFKPFHKLPSIHMNCAYRHVYDEDSDDEDDEVSLIDKIVKVDVQLDFHVASAHVVYIRDERPRTMFVLRVFEENCS